MKNEKRNFSLLFIGLVGVFSPLPMLFAAALWDLALLLITMKFFDHFLVGILVSIIGSLPLLFSPAFNVFGIVCGIIRRKERHSVLCIILSAIGLLQNLFLFLIMYLGRSV